MYMWEIYLGRMHNVMWGELLIADFRCEILAMSTHLLLTLFVELTNYASYDAILPRLTYSK